MSKPEFAIPVVGALLFDREQRLFLMRSSGKFGTYWIVPGGKVSFGEKMADALKREIREETGIEIDGSALLGVREFVTTERHFIFLEHMAWVTNPGIVSLNEEATEYGWFERAQLDDLANSPPTRELIDQWWEKAIVSLPASR